MKKLIVVVGLLFFSLLSWSQISIPKAQSIFLFNFTRMVDWTNNNNSEFDIVIIGNSNVYDESITFFKGKTLYGKTINISKFDDMAKMNINNPQMIFISYNESKNLNKTQVDRYNKSVFIGEKSGILEFVDINFIIVGNKLQFELNETNLNKKNFKISVELKNLANKKI